AAKDIALPLAGLTARSVTELKSELDLDDAVVHYVVDFKAIGLESDYDIDAKTGAIITSKSENDD
ncbi:MAG: PepSY domain-containing protein, partial [Eggerthellaceae bacterium]|nr:PepSY domain-containing protein [Eggerthellaceae bacterium]